MIHPHVNEKHLHSLKGIATESAVIICSILMALQLEDLHQRHEHDKIAREALATFREELVTNRSRAYEVMWDDHHRLETLLPMLERMKKGEDVFANLGVGLTAITTGAWDSALATQALSYMPYEKAKMVAQVYSVQRLEEGLINAAFAPLSLASPLYNGSLDDRIKFFQAERAVLESVGANYKELVAFYDEVLPAL